LLSQAVTCVRPDFSELGNFVLWVKSISNFVLWVKSIKSYLETKGNKIFNWKTVKKESIQKACVNMGG
jgi:hypothetical protein